MERLYPQVFVWPNIYQSPYQAETLKYLGLSSPALSADNAETYMRAVKYGSGVIFASVTLNISSRASLYFISNVSSDILRLFANMAVNIKLTDTGNKNKIVTPGNGGQAETYLDALIGWDLTSGWTTTGPEATIIDNNSFSTNVNEGAGIKKNANSILQKGLYKVLYNWSSTDNIQFKFLNDAGNFIYPAADATIASGAYVTYNDTGIQHDGKVYLRHNTIGQTDITSMSCGQVLTPSLYGIWFTAASEDSGFNLNSASFTVTVTRQ